MSRKSKKGFKRLENHELTEFTTLNGGAGDSESEDLLDLAGANDRESSDRCYSCCCWSTCLYLVLLTIMVAILGVFCGYLMYNVWQINSDTSSRHRELKDSIDNMNARITELKKDTSNRFIVIRGDLRQVNNTVAQLQENANELSKDLATLESRLKDIESQPQEKLIEQVNSIHHEMSLLNRNMNLLNQSLDDVQVMRERVASMGSIMDSYDASFNSYQRQIGDLTQANTDIKNDVIAADDKLKSFGDQLAEVKSSVTTSHDQMKQSDDLLSAQLTQVQSLVSDLNDTLKDEVERVWTNVTKVESTLDVMEQKLSSIEEKLSDTPSPSSSEQPPITPVTRQSTVEPTHSTMTTITTVGNVGTTEPGEDRRPSITTGDGQSSSTTGGGENTNAPSGEPTTPLTELTESHATAATGDVPLTEEEPGMNRSSNVSEGGANSTEGVDTATMEEEDGLTPTTESVPMSDYDNDTGEDLDNDKNTNEQAIEALKIYIDDFELMDRNLDGKLTQFEMGKAGPQIFMLLDTDSDGYVTKEELQHMMTILRAKQRSKGVAANMN